MQISSSVVNAKPVASFRVASSANNNNSQVNQAKADETQKKKDSKNISMAESDLVPNSNRIENIIKRFQKQKELVNNQIELVNKNEFLTVEEKKEKLEELTNKIKMLEDEKKAAIFEENQRKLEEERKKQEELKEKSEVKNKSKNESKKESENPEAVKDMEHILEIGSTYSRINKFRQTKAEMSRQAGRLGGEIAKDIVASGGAQSYSEAKEKVTAGVNPYRDNDWKIKHYNKLVAGIGNLEKSIIDDVAKINKESTKYGKLKVEFAKEELAKKLEENKPEVVLDENGQVVETSSAENETVNTETTEQDKPPTEDTSPDNNNKPENKIVSDAHSKYKNSDGKKIDKKGAVVDTDL